VILSRLDHGASIAAGPSPVPIIALPISRMTARTSAKSRLMRPSLTTRKPADVVDQCRSQRRRRRGKTIPMLERKIHSPRAGVLTHKGTSNNCVFSLFIGFADPRCMLPAPVSHYAFRPESRLENRFSRGYARRRNSAARTRSRNCSGVSVGAAGAGCGFTAAGAAGFAIFFAALRAASIRDRPSVCTHLPQRRQPWSGRARQQPLR
jgi:hypothetical protein